MKILIGTLVVALLCCSISVAYQQPEKGEPATGQAPAGYDILEHLSTGVVYVDRALLERYRELVDRVEGLRTQIVNGVTSSKVAKDELKQLREELTTLRVLIDQKKVLVEPFRSFTRTDEQQFALSNSQRIIITADNVRVKGWDGTGIRCVMEKLILSEQEPDPLEFDAISVKHEVRIADDWVGMTDDERAADQQKFLASDDGRKLSGEAKENRARIVAEIHNSYSIYKDFQGKEVNTIRITGLTAQEGNRMIEGRTRSAGGGATVGGYWKRFARLTVFVPKCQHLAIRGCQETILVNDLHADLLLTNHDSHDRDYGGSFVIDNIDGNIVIHQAPIRSVTNVRGNIDVVQTDEFCNRTTMNRGRYRTMQSAPMATTVFRGIVGDLTCRILRTNLELRDIDGTVDVQNDYGDTRWFVEQAVTEAAHRVLSHSGVIEFITADADTAGIPVYAYTQAGIAKTGFDQHQFDERAFSTDGRGWYGFNTSGAAKDLFLALRRQALALENGPRESGIDLISDAGSVIVDTMSTDP